MAFSLRKMFSNLPYFSKSEEQDSGEYTRNETSHQKYNNSQEPGIELSFDTIEPDSTSKQSTSLKLYQSSQKCVAKKSSLSDTDLLNISNGSGTRASKNLKNLRLDINKANQSMAESLTYEDTECLENTPKHKHLEMKSADIFSEKFKNLNFSQSFEFDMTSESSDDNYDDVESLSDTDISYKEDDKSEIKMCRKVESESEKRVATATPESFADVEMEQNEDDRISLLLNYQMKLEKIESVLKNLLSEFQFHIEVSKVFKGKSMMPALPGAEVNHIPKIWGHIGQMDNIKNETPAESWNVVMETEDVTTKLKFRNQLFSLKTYLENFISSYFNNAGIKKAKNQKLKPRLGKDLNTGKEIHKNLKISTKKRVKHFDFPDYRDAFLHLFGMETEKLTPDTLLLQTDDEYIQKCQYCCHMNSFEQSDSGLTTKSDNSNQSITSSIGNFSLDSNTLSAYSESLDQVISYNSFQDTSILNTLLQKPAIERITSYVQVHSIQLKCEPANDNEPRNAISFYCPACKITEYEEDGLLKHILSQRHCEKIHFLYKTAYIQKCVASGKEIQPSTVLNPMKMYRDDNKIVCFGDAMFACSLCFENLIIGESVLMAHCSDETHLERKNKLSEMFE